jgi:hypothetical protein
VRTTFRRGFFKTAAAVVAAVAVGSAIGGEGVVATSTVAVDPNSLEYGFGYRDADYMSTKIIYVSGSATSLLAFAIRYQDYLFPEWRTNDVASRMFERFKSQLNGESPKCGFYIGCQLSREAFWKTHADVTAGRLVVG